MVALLWVVALVLTIGISGSQSSRSSHKCEYWRYLKCPGGCISVLTQDKNYELTELGCKKCLYKHPNSIFHWENDMIKSPLGCYLENWKGQLWCASYRDPKLKGQHWRKLKTGTGTYMLQSKADKKCIEIVGKYYRLKKCSHVRITRRIKDQFTWPCKPKPYNPRSLPVTRTETETPVPTTKPKPKTTLKKTSSTTPKPKTKTSLKPKSTSTLQPKPSPTPKTKTKPPPTPKSKTSTTRRTSSLSTSKPSSSPTNLPSPSPPPTTCDPKIHCCKYKTFHNSDVYDLIPGNDKFLQTCQDVCSQNSECTGFVWTGRLCHYARVKPGSYGIQDIYPGRNKVYFQDCQTDTIDGGGGRESNTTRPTPCKYLAYMEKDSIALALGLGPRIFQGCVLGCDEISECNSFTWDGKICVYRSLKSIGELIRDPKWSMYVVQEGCTFKNVTPITNATGAPISISTAHTSSTGSSETYIETQTSTQPLTMSTTTSMAPTPTTPTGPLCAPASDYVAAVYCDNNATCIDDICVCNCGLEGDGQTCKTTTCTELCDPHACCINRKCKCQEGYTGNGEQCIQAGSSIGGTVWLDKNLNGKFDGDNECGWPGISVSLYAVDTNILIDSTTTGAKGFYYWTDIESGKYKVMVDWMTVAEGYMLTYTLSQENTAKKLSQVEVSVDKFEEAFEVDFGYGPDPAAYQAPIRISC